MPLNVVSTASDPSTAVVLEQVTTGRKQRLVSVDLLSPDELLSGMLTQVRISRAGVRGRGWG